jgi:hypothetical protein
LKEHVASTVDLEDVPPKPHLILNGLRGVMSQKTDLKILITDIGLASIYSFLPVVLSEITIPIYSCV